MVAGEKLAKEPEVEVEVDDERLESEERCGLGDLKGRNE